MNGKRKLFVHYNTGPEPVAYSALSILKKDKN